MKIGGWKNQAWVTAAVTDEDAKKGIVLVNSLKHVCSNRTMVILVSRKVATTLREQLYYEFDQVIMLDEDRNNTNLKPEDFAKLSALLLKSFEKCIYVSATMMFVRNADEMFDRFEDAAFACMENDNTMPIFVYKPSLESYNVLMKALACRNGTPVSSYIQNWFRNQYNDSEFVYLEPKYGKKIQKGNNKANPDLCRMTDALMVNFLDHPLSFMEWKKSTGKNLSLIDEHALKTWLELYERYVGEEKLLNFGPGHLEGPRLNQNEVEYIKEPVAIVGMSCRFPGSNNIEEFWNLLINAEDGTGNPPTFRWLREQSSRNRPDCRATNAGFLKVPVDEFDAKMFGISPKEALSMDPQHRLLHEIIFEGLEDAAIDPAKLQGTNSGVFMGSWTNDYKDILTHSGNCEFFRTYMGNSIGAAAARISHFLELTGPCIATESGCSSAMVAVHLACKSLLLGETNLALACGVNLLLHPFDKDEMPMVISPDGRCKTFSADANGFARAEGCAALVLKRLSDAVKDGDQIWGLIRGSGVSQEGESRSMGTPTVQGEASAMKKALRDANVLPEDVTYIEAHGTGTVVGDPMEISAIASAYNSRNRREPLIVGSVKTNVGHTESCSGITGIIKTVLAMHHEIIPAHRNFETLNPNINLESVPATIPLEPHIWRKQTDGTRRIAGVSSFGITGTDAHVIIEEPPRLSQTKLVSTLERPQHLLKISAKTEEALQNLLENYTAYLEQTNNSLGDIAFTANTGRGNFPWRAAIAGKSNEDIVGKIRTGNFLKQEVSSDDTGKICFLFTGQGSQYPSMAKQLYDTSDVFRMHFDYCEEILEDMLKISIKDVIWGDASGNGEIARTIYSQTSIFCVEYALLKLWESWGVIPDYVLGHSLGEFAAAVCSGILTPENALKLVSERSQLIDSLPRGKMLVLKTDKDTVTQEMKRFSAGDSSRILDFAAVNSPQQTVVAGDSEVVEDFAKYCTNVGIKSVILNATHAFHSKHMDPILEAYRQVAMSVPEADDEEIKCQYISGMQGCLTESYKIDADYWVDHTRRPVNFLNACKAATELGCRYFVEIGPQPVLSALTMMNNEETTNISCLPSIKRNANDWDTILQTLAALYVNGVAINWEGFDKLYSRKKVRLPNYPFTRKKFWPDMMATTVNIIHPLLGSSIPNASAVKIFQNGLNTRCLEYVKDHAIGSRTIFMGAGYIEMALAAGHSVVECCTESMSRPSRPMKIENLRISAPLELEESKTSQVQIIVDFNKDDTSAMNNDWTDMSVKIYHKLDSKWLPHASATFVPLPTAEEIKMIEFDADIIKKLSELPSDNKMVKQIYEKLGSVGLKFGPIFQSVEKLWRDESGMLSKVKLPPMTKESEQYIIHPAVIDCMIQAIMIQRYSDKIKKKLYVPISVEKFLWLANPKGHERYVYTVNDESAANQAILVDELGTVVCAMYGVELIDTTVKAVESVLEQQTSLMPDMWEESWRSKQGPMFQRLPKDVLTDPGFTQEFQLHMENEYNTVPEDKERLFKNLEELVFFLIVNGLYECGWNPIVGEQFDVKSLVEKLKIEQTHTKFVNWFLEVMSEHDILTKDPMSNCWTVKEMPPTHEEVMKLLSLQQFKDDLVLQFDPTRLIRRIGQSLRQVFEGSQSPLQILFPDDTKTNPSVSGFYDDYGNIFNVAGTISDVQRQRLTSWIEKNEQRDKFVFRIIEIGAGTGIFTSHVLPVLAKLGIQFEYTYTDISQAFFPAAEKRFEQYKSNMQFKKLNIEEDPISQGFSPEYFDYAIASDVLHATKDVCHTLKNVRKLLRDGGSLDIMEQIQKNRVITFIFGLMEGFWRMEDFRTDHCIINSPTWSKCLEKSGFGQIVTFKSFNGRHGLITSHAAQEDCKEMVKPSIEINNLPTWLIFSNPNCKLASYVERKLYKAGRNVMLVEAGENYQDLSHKVSIRGDRKEDFEQLMGSLKIKKIPVEGILYLWALDNSKVNQEEILQPYFYIAQTVFSLKQKVNPKVCAVTQGVAPVGDSDLSHFHSGTLWGFTKAFRNENTDMNCRCISVPNKVQLLTDDEMNEVFFEMWNEDKEPQVAFYNGHRHVARFQSLKVTTEELPLPSGTNRFKLILPETKSIGDLQFGPLENFILGPEEIEVQVKASALNFRDVFSVLKPTDEFKHINAVGFDFSGVVRRVGNSVTRWHVGDSVFGVNVKGDPLPSHIKMCQDDVLRVPGKMTLCEAATLPAVVATAYYCLIDVAKVQPTDVVLIHTASGGVGLSSIDLLKSIGCTIIATAGSKRKQTYLRSLGIEHVFHSRNTCYSDDILKVTNGQGINVVLNSLTGEGFKEATLRACAKGARFVEMSKLNIWKPEEVKVLRPDVDYTVVDVSSAEPEEWRRLLNCLNDLSQRNIVKPIPYVRFDAVNIREALGYMQKAKHIGKVVCVLPEVKLESGEYKAETPLFNDRSTYLITASRGIGFEVAKWMIQKGAKHILMGSRRGPSKATQATIDDLNNRGANIIPVQVDIGNYQQCQHLLKNVQEMDLPPLRGIMHAAGTLNDGLIVNQDWEKLSSTFNAKVNGTLNLHKLTLSYSLEHFVLFSSVVALYGSPGQSNHAAGNSFEDAFAQYRNSVGLCATTVNWGQWGETGVAVEVELPGMKALSTLQGLSALEYVMKHQRLQTCVMNMESFVLFSKLSPQLAVYLDERIWKASGTPTTSLTIRSDEFWQEFDSKEDQVDKVALLKYHLKETLRKILKLDGEEVINDDSNFQEMGCDSLMFVELKNGVQSLMGDRITVSANALRDCNNVNLLSDQLMKLIAGEASVANEEPPSYEDVSKLIDEDCILPEHISGIGKSFRNIEEISTVLLTGATGTLGPYILMELSKLPQIKKIYCLIRPTSNKTTTVQERLLKVLEYRGLVGEVEMDKIQCIEGNVAKSHLGMNEMAWIETKDAVDAIFHLSVKADHTQYYRKRDNVEDVRTVNITGTKNILDLACSNEHHVKHVFYASSLIAVATTDEDGTLSECWPSIEDFHGVTKFSYPISKFVGDILMKKSALERGVPAKVFRLPLIGGDTKSGKCNVEQNHMMLRYLFIMKTGAMPFHPFPVVLLPVDLCASISVKLFFHKDLSSQPSDIYNITHHQPDLDQEFPSISKKIFGRPVDFVEFAEFSEKLFNEPDESIFSMFKEFYRNEHDLTAAYSTTASLRKWLEGVENFWASKKLLKVYPEFYDGLDRTIHYLQQDLLYAKSQGWFERFGIENVES